MEGRTDVSDMYFGRWMERRRETRKRVVQTHEGMIISVFYVTSLTRLLSPQTHRRWNIDLLLFHPRGMLRAFVFTSREISNDSSGRRFLYRLVEISFGGFFFFYLYPKFMDNINSTTRSLFRERDGLPLIRRINSGERRISRFSFSWLERFVWDDFEIHCNSWPIFPSRYDYIIFFCG